ncbi:sulfurtransferase TusA family protein [Kineosporia succinea]|uniref:tRNA 2-thiouridine synthesizing protein A n=1 Tax=Kineosporia succinea TaxID=84632 RepID=A0ABT9P6C5_9ACTN|nr:sulfurtransferase TusA family protein [Kineosporia succinea]MDP9828222.1 tRNA 2-thiouridine synthesizing protein A [Kineosporia succinea]
MVDVVVDARGLRCPLPVIRLAGAARVAAPGTVVVVLSTDAAAEPDIAAWCRMRSAELVDQEWTADETGAFLRSSVRV